MSIRIRKPLEESISDGSKKYGFIPIKIFRASSFPISAFLRNFKNEILGPRKTGRPERTKKLLLSLEQLSELSNENSESELELGL
jgi:hypothetical protein